jgi:hypothetical protein
MSEWQPIETAPKDGRLFVVLTAENDDYRISRAVAWQNPGCSVVVDTTRKLGAPTHWQPLPDSPQ